jgi:aspartate/glutamate racemase
MKTKTIGLLGGMGPEATLQTFHSILKFCQSKYLAVQDEEYPQIIINSLPVTGFDETGIVCPR